MNIPLVSAIMPTRGRPEMARAAVKSWLLQDWRNSELVVMDDPEDPSFPLGSFQFLDADPHLYWPNITYLSVARITVGEKRNLACAVANGAIIIHFDSDDYSAPGRISHQVNGLIEWPGARAPRMARVVGYSALTFHELRAVRVLDDDGFRPPASEWWHWREKDGLAAGTSLCYWRDWWRHHPFTADNLAEDDLFYAEALRLGVAAANDGAHLLRATNHAGCVSGRLIGGAEWEELPGDPWRQ